MDSKDFILTQETASLLPFACYLKRNSATSRLGNIELIKRAYSNFRRYNQETDMSVKMKNSKNDPRANLLNSLDEEKNHEGANL